MVLISNSRLFIYRGNIRKYIFFTNHERIYFKSYLKIPINYTMSKNAYIYPLRSRTGLIIC